MPKGLSTPVIVLLAAAAFGFSRGFFAAAVAAVTLAVAQAFCAFPDGPIRRRNAEYPPDGWSYADLKCGGRTCYRWVGAPDAPVCVFVHGLAQPAVVYLEFAHQLAAAGPGKGYRVLIFDNFGRGYSDAPAAPQTAELFVNQIHELLRAVGVPDDGAVLLAGMSMGGAIATAYAAAYPERVAKLALLAPAGMPAPLPLVTRVLQLPVVGELFVRFAGAKAMAKRVANEFHDPSQFREFLVSEQLRYARDDAEHDGFMRSIWWTLSQFPLTALESTIRRVGAHPRPVLLLWGQYDATTPYANAAKQHMLMPRSTLRTYPDARHLFVHERRQQVVADLAAFFGAA